MIVMRAGRMVQISTYAFQYFTTNPFLVGDARGRCSTQTVRSVIDGLPGAIVLHICGEHESTAKRKPSRGPSKVRKVCRFLDSYCAM